MFDRVRWFYLLWLTIMATYNTRSSLSLLLPLTRQRTTVMILHPWQHRLRLKQQQQLKTQPLLSLEQKQVRVASRLFHSSPFYFADFDDSSPALSSSSSSLPEKKRVVFLGTPDVAALSLQSLYEASQRDDSAYQVVAVVTQPPKRRKRKGKVEASPVGKAAENLGLTVLCPESAKDDAFLTALEQDIRPHVCITAAYGQYLPKRFLAIPPCGTLNIHPSLLPKWRGASPVQRSLEAGDNPVGVTVLFTVSKMDAGPMLAQETVRIDDEKDNASTVLPMLFQIGTNLLLQQVLPNVLSGKITMDSDGATPQNEQEATQAAMIDASEAELRVWQESARTCHNRCRGFSQWPQTYLTVQVGDDDDRDDKKKELIKLKVLSTRVVQQEEGGTRPERTNVIVPGPNKKTDGLYVTCGDGSILELLQVQPPTRKAFPARDFQNGYPGATIRWVKPPTSPAAGDD